MVGELESIYINQSMATRKYEGIKFKDRQSASTLDALTVEEALQININNKAFTVSMRTPGDDIAMVRGLLHAEGIINDVNFNPDIVIKKENPEGIISIVNTNIPEDKLGEGYSNSRSLLSVSSCGICGKTELSDLAFIGRHIDDEKKVDINLISSLFESMKARQHSFAESGGCHAAAAFSIKGDLLSTMEDIGRHNAVDKVVGELILNNELSKAKLMTVSGRVSYEIIIKCFKAHIPFLAAVSAPSSLAVDYAKELGITLFAFSREDRTTCYSHPERVLNAPKSKSKAS